MVFLRLCTVWGLEGHAPSEVGPPEEPGGLLPAVGWYGRPQILEATPALLPGGATPTVKHTRLTKVSIHTRPQDANTKQAKVNTIVFML